MSYWRGKRVTVTGGAGLLGCHLVQTLREQGCDDPFVVRSRDYDLTKEDGAVRLLEATRPDVLFHLAGAVGGIRANRERPASFFYDNLTMGTFLLHHAQRLGVRRFVAAGPGCGYPESAPLPLREESLGTARLRPRRRRTPWPSGCSTSRPRRTTNNTASSPSSPSPATSTARTTSLTLPWPRSSLRS